MDDNKLTLTEHLSELRGRLARALLGILATTALAAIYSPELLEYSIEPLQSVLRDRNRVETLLVMPKGPSASALETQLRAQERVRLRGVFETLDQAVAEAADGAAAGDALDLVLVSVEVLGDEGVLATDALDSLEAKPSVVYLVGNTRAPLVMDLMFEGVRMVRSPPRPAVLGRIIRSVSGDVGKSTAKDRLVVLSPLEPFFAYLKIALVVGLFLACPIWLHQAWGFVAPGLYAHEKSFALPAIVTGSLLFLGGGLFAYFAMFPVMFDVLVNQMMPDSLSSAFTVDKYLGLLLRITVAFGVVFELPLAIAMLSAVGIVTPEGLKRFRKYAVIVAFVVGALLTPADPISQLMMALPLIIFYEVGIFASTFMAKKRDERLATEEDPTDDYVDDHSELP